MNVKFEVIGGTELIARIEAISENISSNVHASITHLIIRLQRNVMMQKLSGQVLNKRTGTLARSIDVSVNARKNEIIGTTGTNLLYGHIHEYGYSGTAHVKEHLRRQTKAWGKPLKETKFVLVRAHPKKINLPERSFLRTALAEMQPEIEQEITAAVEKGVKHES